MGVYFIQSGVTGSVKIGYARDPAQRLKALQTAHHAELRLLRVIEGGFLIERWLRERFRHCWQRGEWHGFDPEMLTVEVPATLDADLEAARLERTRKKARERARRKSATWVERGAGLEGYAPDTAASYVKVWTQFLRWRGMGDDLPVSDQQVILFLERRPWRSRHALENAIAGLSTMHRLLGHDKLTLRPALKAWMKATYAAMKEAARSAADVRLRDQNAALARRTASHT